jgi:hypothetical protein
MIRRLLYSMRLKINANAQSNTLIKRAEKDLINKLAYISGPGHGA